MRARLIPAFAVLGLTVALPTMAFAQDAPEGKALYLEHCKKCHGVLGTPPKTMQRKYPDIVAFDASFAERHSVDSIVTVLRKGSGEDMKPFTEKMSPAEMRLVAEYVRFLATKP